MGCWNKTCGLSNLHISGGDEVYVFPLEQNNDNGRCYSTAFWSPVMLPFTAIYDDYGGGEESSKNIQYTLNGLKKYLIEMPLGDNEYHDIAVSKDILDEELFYRAVDEGRLKVKYDGLYGGEHLVDFVMFRKDIVDDICENWEVDDYVGNGEWVKFKFRDILDTIPVFMERVTEALRDNSEFGIKSEKHLFCKLFMRHEEDRNLAFMYLERVNGNYRYSRIVKPIDIIINLMAENKLDEAKEIIVDTLRASFISVFMDVCRKIWVPACHEGSQSMEHKPYKVLCNAINNALDKEDNYFRIENGEDYCE